MTKTWKALQKRTKISKRKKLLKKQAGKNHLNTKNRSKTLSGKRRKTTFAKKVESFL